MIRLPATADSWLDARASAMTAALADLVRVPGENPPGRACEESVAVLVGWLERLGVPCRVVSLPPPPGSPRAGAVLAEVGTSGPIVYFHGHYDVVPASEPGQFDPVVDGDTLFGRGSSDMKGGLVSLMFAAAALRATGELTRGRVRLVFVPDEETGGAHGTAALFESHPPDPEAVGMLLAEPTSGVVWHANRGALSFAVTVRGRAAHVGLQHTGINAVEHAMTLLARFVDLKQRLPAGSLLLVGGRVEAGTNFNVVPDRCRFTLDRRTNPDEDLDRAREQIVAVVEQARSEGIDCDIEVLQEGRPSWSSPDTGVASALAAAIGHHAGTPPAFECCPGLLETRFYAARGIPAYAYGPGILAVSHGPKEFVRLSRVLACAKIYAAAAVAALAADAR